MMSQKSSVLLFFLVLFLLLFFGQTLVIAESVAVSVPRMMITTSLRSLLEKERSDQSAYLEVLSSAGAPSLVSAGKGLEVSQLSFVKSLQMNPDDGNTEVVLRENVTFSNGAPLQASDAVYSLSLCKESLRKKDSEKNGDFITVESLDSPLRFVLRGSTSEATRVLSSCPIFERASGVVFGNLLGTANFFVGLGPYEISQIKPGIRVTFKKVKDGWTNVRQHAVAAQYVDEIEVRVIPEARRALTALRFGSVDLVFSENMEIRGIAMNDETLAVGECRGYHVIYRRGLRLDCDDERWVSKLRYLG